MAAEVVTWFGVSSRKRAVVFGTVKVSTKQEELFEEEFVAGGCSGKVECQLVWRTATRH